MVGGSATYSNIRNKSVTVKCLNPCSLSGVPPPALILADERECQDLNYRASKLAVGLGTDDSPTSSVSGAEGALFHWLNILTCRQVLLSQPDAQEQGNENMDDMIS